MEVTNKLRFDVDTLVGLKYSEIRRRAQAFLVDAGGAAFDCASGCYGDGAWEVRAFAVHVLGGLAAHDRRALAFLFERCGNDPFWQLNEALATAFDDYCAAVGYEQALPELRRWLQAPSPNLRRAVSEGLRPWTSQKRTYFARNPELAIDLLGTLKDDDSRYVPESVGNALRDISRKHTELVVAALQTWLQERPDAKSRRTIARYALKQGGAPEAELDRVLTRA
jgi:hypothetical protein